LGLAVAHAHVIFDADPRIIYVSEQDNSEVLVLVRMPVPLALLPDDWKGHEDPRIPPFGSISENGTKLDLSAVVKNRSALETLLRNGMSISIGGEEVELHIEEYRFWADDSRPNFGTWKAALRSFAAEGHPIETERASYFDLTLDVMITIEGVDLLDHLRIESTLGHQFREMQYNGTVLKLRRNEIVETKGVLGLLDVSFPRVEILKK